MIGRSASTAIPDVAIIATPRSANENEQHVMPGTNARTRPFLRTCCPTSTEP
jgi:hypothetical protein